MNKRWLAPAGLVAAALIAAGCGSSGGSGGAANAGGAQTHSGTTTVKTTKISGATVLTNAQGFTLYWFAPDTRTTSKCNGSCASFWPPLKGPASGSVKGSFATITRSDGSMQATFNGHPLYTYRGDTQPGQNNGNGVNLNGGVWHEVTVSGSAPASSPSPKSTSGGGGGGGYGY